MEHLCGKLCLICCFPVWRICFGGIRWGFYGIASSPAENCRINSKIKAPVCDCIFFFGFIWSKRFVTNKLFACRFPSRFRFSGLSYLWTYENKWNKRSSLLALQCHLIWLNYSNSIDEDMYQWKRNKFSGTYIYLYTYTIYFIRTNHFQRYFGLKFVIIPFIFSHRPAPTTEIEYTSGIVCIQICFSIPMWHWNSFISYFVVGHHYLRMWIRIADEMSDLHVSDSLVVKNRIKMFQWTEQRKQFVNYSYFGFCVKWTFENIRKFQNSYKRRQRISFCKLFVFQMLYHNMSHSEGRHAHKNSCLAKKKQK